jgi:hypothetical protein
MNRIVCWLAAGAVLLLAACHPRALPLSHDAYIWQRQWTPALRDAMAVSGDLVSDWRVLVAQADADGRFHGFAVDRDALTHTGRPVVIVIRIDGRLAAFDEATLLSRVLTIARAWPGAAGVEIDYDCPTARLPAYTAFLKRLKPELGGTPLSITALPTWLTSANLDALLAVPDTSVLQVHAVQAPQAGLFDATVAMAWISEFAAHTNKPFRVALPTYGARVSWQADGTLLAVESETTTLAGNTDADEFYVSADVLRDVVDRLERDRPRGLVGVSWFRLPTRDDARAWSLATWRGVVTGHVDATPLRAQLQAGPEGNGPFDIVLENPGTMDTAAPAIVSLPPTCASADGINGYALTHAAGPLSLVAERARPLRAGARRSIGWARCTPGTPMTLITRAKGMPLS